MITSWKQVGCRNIVGYTDKDGNKFRVEENLITNTLKFIPITDGTTDET